VSCVHQPVGGMPAQLIWAPEASVEGEQIAVCVCIRCGAVFAGLFTTRTQPTPEEGAYRYTGPFVGFSEEAEGS